MVYTLDIYMITFEGAVARLSSCPTLENLEAANADSRLPLSVMVDEFLWAKIVYPSIVSAYKECVDRVISSLKRLELTPQLRTHFETVLSMRQRDAQDLMRGIINGHQYCSTEEMAS